jgi:hypothetical protein
MHKILVKAARSKHTKSELFHVSLHFAEELESIKTNFGPESDTQLKNSVTECADVTHQPHGLPPHRGIFDQKIVLPLILNGNDVPFCLALSMRNLKDNAVIFSNMY